MVNTTSLTLTRFSIFIFPLLFLVSCGTPAKDNTENKPVPESNKSIALVDKGIKTLPLDSLVDFERLMKIQIKEIDGIEYLSFYDRETASFYIHNYESGKLIQKTPLAQKGPDKVIIFILLDYYIHSLDSIFINAHGNGYFLVNSQGKVIEKSKKDTQDWRSSKFQITFDESSYLSERGLHGSVDRHQDKKVEHFPFVRGTFNFDTGKLKTDSLHARTIFHDYDGILEFLKNAKKQKKRYVNIHRSIMSHSEYLYATTNISDSIRVFKNQQLIKSIYAGLPDYKVTDYSTYLKNNEVIQTKISKNKGEYGGKVVLKQPPLYIRTQIDPQGKFIYRVVSHGTKAGIHPYDGSDIPVISGATLLVINLETEKHYRYELPIKEIDVAYSFLYNAYFVSNAGIHFRVKEQENENQVKFRVFGMNNHE